MELLRRDKKYRETHNAVLDAEDELKIMQLLGDDISQYDIALISAGKNPVTEQQEKAAKLPENILETSKKKKGILAKLFNRK